MSFTAGLLRCAAAASLLLLLLLAAKSVSADGCFVGETASPKRPAIRPNAPC
jgi:hypothetical protein